MAHKDMKSLVSKIGEKAKKSLETNVAPIVKEKMKQNIKREVYDVYSPVEYKRTNTLLSLKSMPSKVEGDLKEGSKMMLKVSHQDSRNPSLTVLIIKGQTEAKEYGSSMMYNEEFISKTKSRWAKYGKTDKKGFWEGRDFISPTREDIRREKSKIVDVFKKGMK